MQSFFSDPGGVGREIALRSLRRDIVGLIGGPVKIHDAVFIDAPLADFFVTERDRDLYAIRWLESQDFAVGLTRTLSAYVRLHETGRGELARSLDLPHDFPPATLVLVTDRMDDDWVRVVSTLKIPVMLLRAHSLVDGTRHSAGCLFERCFAARALPERPAEGGCQPGPVRKAEPDIASVAQSGAPGPGRDRSFRPAAAPLPSMREAQPGERPEPLAESSAARQLRSMAGVKEERFEMEEGEAVADDDAAETSAPRGFAPQSAEDGEVGAPDEPRESTEAQFDDVPEPPRGIVEEPPAAADDPERLLSEEEIATFRLLENVLESTRSH